MTNYVGLDVSQKSTTLCVVDGDGRRLWRGQCASSPEQIADRIGPAPALLVSSSMQAAALLAYFGSDGLMSLYIVTAMFGLVQGGIVPTYALIIRKCYPPSQAGTRVGLVLSSTLAGMAIGGW